VLAARLIIDFCWLIGVSVGVYTLTRYVFIPLGAAGVRALMRLVARVKMATVTLRDVQGWHQHCRDSAQGLKDKRRKAERGDPSVRWTPHHELTLACYERLANETAELAELLARPVGEVPPATAQ